MSRKVEGWIVVIASGEYGEHDETPLLVPNEITVAEVKAAAEEIQLERDRDLRDWEERYKRATSVDLTRPFDVLRKSEKEMSGVVETAMAWMRNNPRPKSGAGRLREWLVKEKGAQDVPIAVTVVDRGDGSSIVVEDPPQESEEHKVE